MFMVAWGSRSSATSLFPTAPPRFFPEWGFIDSVAEFTGVHHDSYRQRAVQPLRGRALDARRLRADDRLPARPAGQAPRNKVAWSLYPLLVTFVVVATANHFLLDAVLGAVTAAVAAAAAWLARGAARGASRPPGRGTA